MWERGELRGRLRLKLFVKSFLSLNLSFFLLSNCYLWLLFKINLKSFFKLLQKLSLPNISCYKKSKVFQFWKFLKIQTENFTNKNFELSGYFLINFVFITHDSKTTKSSRHTNNCQSQFMGKFLCCGFKRFQEKRKLMKKKKLFHRRQQRKCS